MPLIFWRVQNVIQCLCNKCLQTSAGVRVALSFRWRGATISAEDIVVIDGVARLVRGAVDSQGDLMLVAAALHFKDKPAIGASRWSGPLHEEALVPLLPSTTFAVPRWFTWDAGDATLLF